MEWRGSMTLNCSPMAPILVLFMITERDGVEVCEGPGTLHDSVFLTPSRTLRVCSLSAQLVYVWEEEWVVV